MNNSKKYRNVSKLLIGMFVTTQIFMGLPTPTYAQELPKEEPILESGSMRVVIDEHFPTVKTYTLLNSHKVFYGQEDILSQVMINNTLYEPTVTFSEVNDAKANYMLNFKTIQVTMNVVMEVNENSVTLTIDKIKEEGTFKVNTIEIPNHTLISVRNTQKGAALAATKMYTAKRGTGDTFVSLEDAPKEDSIPQGYMYGFINTDELGAAIWTNSVYDKPSGATGADNSRIKKQTVKKDGYYRTGLWSGQFTYRADGMNEVENAPTVKVIITEDRNDDKKVNWQDSAIAFREIMNSPYGAESVPKLVVQRIPMNFGSQATNPFLRTLDETKRIYLATDGLGQNVLLKGYQSEGHDSAHPDYGSIGKRQGGAKDMQVLVDEGAKYNAKFGVHVNATESYPEAKSFSEELVDPAKKGWDWIDASYYIKTRNDATSSNRLNRFKELKDQVPGLDFIYVDVWYGDGWESRQIAKEINGLGWRLETEFPNKFENESTWMHWSADVNYGGEDLKGFNSQIVRFIRNHQKDNWIVGHPLLGGTEIMDAEGWQGHKDFNKMIQTTFEVDLPTKYLQSYEIMKWETDAISFKDTVKVFKGQDGQRVITKDDREVLKGKTYLLPWEPKEETKLYHYNKTGGTTTWKVPKSWQNVTNVKLYELTDQGKLLTKEIAVEQETITIEAKANTPYVIYKNETIPTLEVTYGEEGVVKDSGFNKKTLESWDVTEGTASVTTNENGQNELIIEGPTQTTVAQTITGLKEGTYAASVNVEVNGKRKALIGIANLGNEEVNNYTETSYAKNYISADSKHSTNMQRMRVLFDVPAGKDSATLYLKAENGPGTVKFDDVRVVETKRTPNPTNAYFTEDFENVEQGLFPFVKGLAGGVTDPRTHLSERHEPYTQKGWDGKVIDDVISGDWSLKIHKEGTGLLLQTLPQTLRFEPSKIYKVSFKYEGEVDNAYGIVVGNKEQKIWSKALPKQTTPKEIYFYFEADESGESWFGINSLTGAGDFVIDEIIVEEAEEVLPDNIPVPPIDLRIIPKENMTATATSEEVVYDNNSAACAIDDSEGTLWHIAWDYPNQFPYAITVDLGGNYAIDTIDITPRQDNGNNGRIRKYEVQISSDGKTFQTIDEGTWAIDKGIKKITLKEKLTASHIRVIAKTGEGGFASIAEITVYREMPSIVAADSIKIQTKVGKAPILPQKMPVKLNTGETVVVPVEWEAIDRSLYQKEGKFIVKGTANTTNFEVVSEVTVGDTLQKAELLVSTPQIVSQNQVFDITFMLKNARDIQKLEGILSYDHNLFQLEGAQVGDTEWELTKQTVLEDNQVSYSIERKSGSDITSELCNILTLKFKALKDSGKGRIALMQVHLIDKNNKIMSPVVEESTVKIEPICDINGDGKITVSDLGIMAKHYGKESTSPDWAEASLGDINKDGKIDITDLSQLALRIMD